MRISIRLLLSVLLLVSVLLTMPAVVAAQSLSVDQDELLLRAQSSDWTTRYKTFMEIAAIPPGSRSSAVVDAAVSELVRLEQARDNLAALGIPAGPEAGELFTEHLTRVTTIVAGSSNPAIIEPLVQSIGLGVGKPLFDALARFGPYAAPQVLAAVIQHSEDREYMLYAFFVLQWMAERNPDLPLAWRMSVAEIAKQHMTGRRFSAEVHQAIQLARAIRVPAVIPALNTIVQARSASEAGLYIHAADVARVDPFIAIRADARAAIEALSAGK